MTRLDGRREEHRRDVVGARAVGRSGPVGAVPAAAVVAAAIFEWQSAAPGALVVAIDGHGASGKTTIAAALGLATGATVARMDDFYVPATEDVRLPERPAPRPSGAVAVRRAGRVLDSYYDVARLRAELLAPLCAGREAVFHPFDWGTGVVSDEERRLAPNDLVLLEGVYSGAPELADIVDRSIYVDTPEPERLRRLRGIIRPEEWDGEWLRAEKAYFEDVRPPSSFDLVVPGAAEPPGRKDGTTDDSP